MTNRSYTIATDSETETVTARDMDEAARLFSRGSAPDAETLARRVEKVGGWLTISEGDAIVLRAGER